VSAGEHADLSPGVANRWQLLDVALQRCRSARSKSLYLLHRHIALDNNGGAHVRHVIHPEVQAMQTGRFLK
jgi:hypothetical protein